MCLGIQQCRTCLRVLLAEAFTSLSKQARSQANGELRRDGYKQAKRLMGAVSRLEYPYRGAYMCTCRDANLIVQHSRVLPPQRRDQRALRTSNLTSAHKRANSPLLPVDSDLTVVRWSQWPRTIDRTALSTLPHN